MCRTDLNECTGAEPEPTPEPTEAPNIEPEAEESDGFNAAALLPIALIVILGTGGAYYFLFRRCGVAYQAQFLADPAILQKLPQGVLIPVGKRRPVFLQMSDDGVQLEK